MEDYAKKALWVALPALVAAVTTIVPGPTDEVQLVVYGLMTFIAMAGIWATNLKTHRKERELDEKARWDKLNARLDSIDDRLDRGEEANRAMLRSELIRAHREWVEDKGYITMEAHLVLAKTHKAYKASHGNDTGDKLWEDLDVLPIKG